MVSLAKAHRASLVEESCRLKRRAAILLEICSRLALGLKMADRTIRSSSLANLAEGEELPEDLVLAIEVFSSLGDDLSPAARHLSAAHRLGEGLDLLLASEVRSERKKSGSYYTPVAVARSLVARSLRDSNLQQRAKKGLSICDPACGGGAFVLEAAAQVSEIRNRGEEDFRRTREEVVKLVFGIDLSPLAISVARLSLWLFVGLDKSLDRANPSFVLGDALLSSLTPGGLLLGEELEREGATQLDLVTAFPQIFCGDACPSRGDGFDWIVGNPPWVAFQGRATQVITKARRAFYRRNYRAFSGYPTLHGLFVEKSTQLSSTGYVSLLLPSSVSDLDGYKKTREVLCCRHEATEPLLEFGQDVFEGVTQPCFGLVAVPREEDRKETIPSRPWRLVERTRVGAQLVRVEPPRVLSLVEETLPKLIPETFREMGFQSNRTVAGELFLRGEEAAGEFNIPLLEGRNVGEFTQRAPRLFLKNDQQILKATKCRLRPLEVYSRVDLVVRQTAAFTIAAKHSGIRFRNSLIGAFASEFVDQDLLLGLMNSSLFRALHIRRQRDARQAAFPQVKVGHLRCLPAPPADEAMRSEVRKLSCAATVNGGLNASGRARLDRAVFSLFSLSQSEGEEVLTFLRERLPSALRASL